jgi:carboxymethylenebutenolidase
MITPQGVFGCLRAGAAVALVALAACRPATETDQDAEAAREATAPLAAEHANETGEPNPEAAIPPEQAVVAETLAYAEVDDQLVHGHFVFPSDMVDPLPAVLVIHEWWGLNDGVRAMADRLAGEGYIVLAVDLFGGRVAETPEEARKLVMEVLEDPDAAEENIRQAYRFVKETAGAPRIASLGWCFGGTWAMNAALLFPKELDAAVIYYGQVGADEQALAGLDVPILGHFGEADRSIPLDSVERFRQALEAAGVVREIRIYPGAGHAFANPSGQSYDAEAAREAWELSLAFLERHLAVPTTAD